MLDPNGVIFSTVTQFVEQVGRRQQWRYADLDIMVCIWNGPAYGAWDFKPQAGSPHPQFPLMFVTDSQIINEAALVAEIQVTYQGRIDSNHKTEPQLSTSPFQGSRDFTTGWMYQSRALQYTQIAAPGLPSGQSIVTADPLYAAGTKQVTIRWWGENANVLFHAYPLPGDAQFSGLGLSNCKWELIGWFEGPMVTSVFNVSQDAAAAVFNQYPTQPYVTMEKMYLGRSVVQRGKWYEITEQYGYVPTGP
jgi:hypothetical protein